MRFDLKSPCSSCPFRRDVPAFLHPQRAREICDAILKHDETFACHKTVDYSEEGEPYDPEGEGDILLGNLDEGRQTQETHHCAGALILAQKLGHPNQLTRIAGRMGLYDHRKLRLDAPVFDTPAEMIRHHRKG